jgi:hypothetical protein
MEARRFAGWLPREGSWEEAVVGWHEQMVRSFRRREVVGGFRPSVERDGQSGRRDWAVNPGREPGSTDP